MYFKSVFLQSYWVIDRTASKSLFIFVIVDHQSHHFIVTLNATFLAVGLKVAVIGLVKNNFNDLMYVKYYYVLLIPKRKGKKYNFDLD